MSKPEARDAADADSARSQRRSQPAKMIDPLPAHRAAPEWKKKPADPEPGGKQRGPGVQRGEKQCSTTDKQIAIDRQFVGNDKQQFAVDRSAVGDVHRGRIANKRAGPEHTAMDRFGRVMPIQPETSRVLNRLPDLSFLSARSLMLDREHKQIACEIGVINRKMPG